MRTLAIAALTTGFLCAAGPAIAQPLAEYGQLSWGKLDITYLQYRSDAVSCTAEGTLAVLDETPSQLQSIPPGGGGMGAAVANGGESAVSEGPPEPDIHAIVANLRMQAFQASTQAREQRQAIVDDCLIDRGYRPFLLSDEQRARLSSFERGTAARHRFLFSLATDPAVVQGQAYRVPGA